MSLELNPALLQRSVAPNTSGAGAPPAAQTAAGADGATARAGGSFAELLRDASAPGDQPLRFSRHAIERIQRRNIPVDGETLGRLKEGVGRMQDKGARDSLVLVDGTAFVVSVGNRTVITAVGPEHMREQVFTNIDSAAIA